jgi:hypothetical protein
MMSSTISEKTPEGHHHYRGLTTRWLMSISHKDIGTPYLVFSASAGLVGGMLSILMRLQLMHPGQHYVGPGQEWNTIVPAHGLVMIFFILMPALGWVRQVRPAYDWCARHGLPTPEQHQLLVADTGVLSRATAPRGGRLDNLASILLRSDWLGAAHRVLQ